MVDIRRPSWGGARTLAAFVAERWRTLAVDVALVTAWALGLLWLVGLTGWPPWVYYAALLAGAVGYSLVAGWSEAA